jgi:hypothetical protein
MRSSVIPAKPNEEGDVHIHRFAGDLPVYNKSLDCSLDPALMGGWAARSNGEWQPRMGLMWRPMSGADFPERPAYFFYHWGGHLDIWLDASGKSFWNLVVPFWIPQSAAVLLAMLALHPVLHDRRLMYRVRRGLCRHCGYDLRATPDCCPECGTVSKREI